jgi:hypothetical protein
MSLLNRREALAELLQHPGGKEERDNLIIVTGLGSPAYDLASCGNEPLDFPLWARWAAWGWRSCNTKCWC